MNLKSESFFKELMLGYTIGAGAMFIPPLLFIIFVSTGKHPNIGYPGALIAVAVILAVLLIQGAVLGGLVKIGLWLANKVST